MDWSKVVLTIHIVIGICTCRRPEGLRALLRSLQELDVPAEVSAEVVIVDNDTSPSAQGVVSDFTVPLALPVRYVHEADPGIPQARNRMLREAKYASFLLFVDDDETVTPSLLREHLRVQKATGAAFVQGPCVKTVEDPQDRWWLDTLFFKERLFEDYTPRNESWTNNVLIDISFTEAAEVRFDPGLRFAGGTDTLFFQDVVRHGGKGVFASRAIVQEVQSKDRLTWRWSLRRQFRYGLTRANTRLLRHPPVGALLYCTVRAIGMAAVGLAYLGSAVVRGKRGLADGMALLARGAGVASGAVGLRMDEYKRN